MTLHELGFDDFFAAQAAATSLAPCAPARVCAVDRGVLRIRDEEGMVAAEMSGALSFGAQSAEDLPCVGDWVTARRCGDGTLAIVQAVLPRRSFLRRRAPGGRFGFQMIAANVDTACIAQSCLHDFNPARLERYLVAAADGGVAPLVLLTKADLLRPEEVRERVADIRAATGWPSLPVLVLSCVSGEGIAALKQALAPGRTFCLLGSSGVGKTTLLNRLLGSDAFETSAVSGTGEGTHTTTRRQLVVLGQGAILIDTPGMREFGLMDACEGLDMAFADFSELAGACRYADCSHVAEPGCAVLGAVERGEIPAERYRAYLKLRRESEHHALSLVERRRKDKSFGRMVKQVKRFRGE